MCLIGIVLALLLQKNNPELAILLALSVCGGVLLFGLSRIKDVFAVLEQMAQAGGLSADLLEPLVKTVGIALITHTGAELCRDADQKAMASVVEAAGAFSAIVVSIPLLGMVWELLRGMLRCENYGSCLCYCGALCRSTARSCPRS